MAKCPGQAECRATEPASGRGRGAAGLRYSALRGGWTGRRRTVEGQGHEGRPHAVRNRPVQSTKRPRLVDHAGNAAPAGRNDIPHFTFRAATQADSKSNFESAWVLKKKDCPGVARRGSGSAAGCPGPFARRLPVPWQFAGHAQAGSRRKIVPVWSGSRGRPAIAATSTVPTVSGISTRSSRRRAWDRGQAAPRGRVAAAFCPPLPVNRTTAPGRSVHKPDEGLDACHCVNGDGRSPVPGAWLRLWADDGTSGGFRSMMEVTGNPGVVDLVTCLRQACHNGEGRDDD